MPLRPRQCDCIPLFHIYRLSIKCKPTLLISVTHIYNLLNEISTLASCRLGIDVLKWRAYGVIRLNENFPWNYLDLYMIHYMNECCSLLEWQFIGEDTCTCRKALHTIDVHHQFHNDSPECEPGLPVGKPATIRLSSSIALSFLSSFTITKTTLW